MMNVNVMNVTDVRNVEGGWKYWFDAAARLDACALRWSRFDSVAGYLNEAQKISLHGLRDR